MTGCKEEHWLYWGAETSSEDGQKGMLKIPDHWKGLSCVDRNSTSPTQILSGTKQHNVSRQKFSTLKIALVKNLFLTCYMYVISDSTYLLVHIDTFIIKFIYLM